MRKLEVVHKEVGGYLSIAQIDNGESLSQSVSQSLTNVGIELLGQLKMKYF